MNKLVSRMLILVMAFGFASFAMAGEGTEGTWTGYVTETHCGASGAKAAHADCAAKCVKDKGAKWALYTPADKGVWVLSNQEEAAKMSTKEVTVKGSLDKEAKTITVVSMELAPPKS